MPIRLLQLPDMKLIEKGDIFKHLLPKLTDITESWIADKIQSTKWEEVAFVSGKADRRKRVIEEGVKERAQYAILSHTWLLDEREIIYDDWKTQQNLSGAGYAKLKNFCQVAYRDHGMTLAWLDTLCINKDSTSELDESIRSMYRWYRYSAICIVILAETTVLDDVPKDRWFTRGWTLQELLAPGRLKFYSKSWTQLLDGHNDKGHTEKDDDDDDDDDRDGDNDSNHGKNKSSNLSVFAPLIEKATGISLDELRTFDPAGTRRNIPTRMIWASKRVTTREEDSAYCLMGFFGVSFSIAYGEGRERAFFRLLEAIMTTYRDILAILDWSGKPIGRDVHATSLFPSGPECYKRILGEARLESFDWSDIQDYVPFSFAPKEPMTLTHLGIRIDLYCVPATVHSFEEHDGIYTVSMKCGARFREEPIVINVYPHTYRIFDEEEDEGYGKEFMFGIWTFERDSQDTVYIPNQPCRVFLLESTDHYQPIEMPRVWNKVDTPDPLRISPDSPWEDDWDKEKISIKTFIL
ncbi:hypothetical protein CVT25_000982 [Psilocybe cyanescens]|uniref:Heterokaryon incompatibility domain-containing protein n=1 Tax=Psilocybe cyanescens TaxID=93625 RepID=A0A409XMC5_PSICY|nr:hypothetical protein CVT25_000982 [Psilocybe cyanescens]